MIDMAEILLDALLDCAKLLPFLLVTVFFMEWIEHRAGERLSAALQKAGPFGPLAGALLGCIPQCGFSAACAQLFNGGLITAGTLAAVFLSTSDEAVPILIAYPDGWRDVGLLLLVKLAVSVIAGLVLDALWRREKQQAAYALAGSPHICESDGRFVNILWASVKRTASIFLFLFLVTLALGTLIALVGEERLAACLLPGPFQPVLAALVGFIPNCAASVLLTRLYLDGMISFGSAVAGLCTASGVGLLVLLRGKRGAKTCLILLGSVFAAATLAGLALQLVL